MGAYPPPYPPPYDRSARRAQRRMAQQQVRLQRHQLRLQRYALRRRSIVGPMLLLALGVAFLLAQLGTLSWPGMVEWYGRWWPAILIVAGLILLLEWAIDQRQPAQRQPAQRQPLVAGARPQRSIGGGVILLLLLLTFAGLATAGFERGLDWKDRTFGHGFGDLDHVFGDRHDGYSSLSAALAPGATLAIRDPRGDVTVTGSSPDGQVHVTVHAQAYAWKDGEAQTKIQRLQPTFFGGESDRTLVVRPVDGGRTDLTIAVPPATSLTINADRGDVNLSQLQAPVSLSANHGDVQISGIGAAVRVNTNDDDANLTLHAITGSVTIEGHSGDIDITEVGGALQLQGDFYGTTHLEHVNGPVHFESSRTSFSAAGLNGDFSVENDSLDANAILGPVALKTSDKNITLNRVQGDLNLTDSDGTVEATMAAPGGVIDIENRNGSVDLGLPAGPGFLLRASTRNGDLENDFGMTANSEGDRHAVAGTVGSGGPAVNVATTDGDVTVRKITAAPLEPAAPAVTIRPAAPARKGPHVPAPPVTGTVF